MTKLLNIIADDCIPHNDIHVRARDKPGMTGDYLGSVNDYTRNGNGQAMLFTMSSFVAK